MNRLSFLLQRYADNQITSEELEELFVHVSQLPEATVASELMNTDESRSILPVNLTPEKWRNNWSNILKSIPDYRKPVHRVHFFWKWGWVAAAMLLLSTGAYLYLKPHENQLTTLQRQPVSAGKDIEPGKEGAILTLADGKEIELDSLGNGVVAQQSGVNVLLENGQLAYSVDNNKNKEVMWNTMTTPRGRQFKVVLPDGTRVWLNAASSLRYPTRFIGSSRTVEVTGEAYFEVAANKAMPFKLKISAQTSVEVLGTHFNVNAYADEPSIRTTLIEGRIRFNKETEKVTLTPGQQVVATENIIVKNTVNVEQVIAWKNGVFNFTDAPLDEFMRQLARWYDLEVVYEGVIPKKVFKGKLDRNLALSQILEVLSIYDMDYRLNGKTLTIKAK